MLCSIKAFKYFGRKETTHDATYHSGKFAYTVESFIAPRFISKVISCQSNIQHLEHHTSTNFRSVFVAQLLRQINQNNLEF